MQQLKDPLALLLPGLQLHYAQVLGKREEVEVGFPLLLEGLNHHREKNVVALDEVGKYQTKVDARLVNERCSICLGGGCGHWSRIGCNHMFHSKCIETHIVNHDARCPLCRKEVCKIAAD